MDKVLYSSEHLKAWDRDEKYHDVVEPDPVYKDETVKLHDDYELEILIVDDSKTVQYLMKKLLMQRGYNVLQAYDGKSGIIMAKRHKPSLIIMDVMMPGINGFQATRFIKKDQEIANIPILMISGSKQASEKFWASKLGINHYMNKPFSRSDLFDALDITLQIKSRSSGHTKDPIINTIVEPDSSYEGQTLDIV
ncbi:MAG: response regulator [Gammaproteobacteria bacterium]|nr:response regulator [Gammaproteobacteria bacterium]